MMSRSVLYVGISGSMNNVLSAGNHTNDNNANVHTSSLSAGSTADVAVAY